MADTNGWGEWSRHVLAELVRLNNCYEDMNKSLTKVHVNIGQLQIKSGVWGAIGGCIPVLIMIILYVATRK